MFSLRVTVVCLALVATLSLVAVDASRSTTFPLSTLLEHTAIASNGFAPEGRTRLEKLALTQTPRLPEFLGSRQNQILFHGDDARGNKGDTPSNVHENRDRAKEPSSNFFNQEHGAVNAAPQPSNQPGVPDRAPRLPCIGPDCNNDGPYPIPPNPVPPPPAPVRPPPANIPAQPHAEFPVPPPPELPLPSPPKPDCNGICDPDAKDPVLARVPAAPLDDAAVAAVGLEGAVLAKVTQKLRNREGWLRAQKLWLTKAVEAAATVRREIELAEFTKDAVASDLDQLKQAQDALSIKYKADRLKWAFKDRKMDLEAVRERLEALEHAKADVAHNLRQFKDEVIILENTLGPPSQQVQISVEELEDPLEFLNDVIAEHNYSQY